MSYNNAISASDPQAVEKLTDKLQKCEELQAVMKEVNAYWRKTGTCQGAPGITEAQAKKIDDTAAGTVRLRQAGHDRHAHFQRRYYTA